MSVESVQFETMEVDENRIEMFGEVSGDRNPLHFDEEAAEESIFGERVAHGMLVASLISATLEKFEGEVILVEQDIRYINPVYYGDTVYCVASIKESNGDFDRVTTNIYTQENQQKVVEGEAQIKRN